MLFGFAYFTSYVTREKKSKQSKPKSPDSIRLHRNVNENLQIVLQIYVSAALHDNDLPARSFEK